LLLNPPILALVGVSLAVAALMLLAAGFAVRVLRHWDLQSGSARQLALERRTYLISTLVAYCFIAELVSLLLFIYNAEQMSSQFVGAMCATGVLNVNPLGWPALWLKIAVFFAGATWLMLNRMDNQACDYPLVRIKYGLLLAILPLVVAEAAVTIGYFLALRPDVITSCCGSLFSPEGAGIAAEVAGVEPRAALLALYATGLATGLSGVWYLWRQRGGVAFATLGALGFGVALVGIVSGVALYIYEHPHHHCPFCILKAGYDYIGYALYLPLFAATALGLGVGVVSPWRDIPSLRVAVAADARRFTMTALLLLAIFYLVASLAVARSNLTMLEVWW
jgi:hypothetical protein